MATGPSEKDWGKPFQWCYRVLPEGNLASAFLSELWIWELAEAQELGEKS